MSVNIKTTLQINLSPSDFKHAHLLLPHQLKQWNKQFDEILITLDMKRSYGKFGADWEEGREYIFKIIENCYKNYSNLKLIEVDYSNSERKKVSSYFFNNVYVPDKDYRGGPYYSYFYGLYKAKNNYILHIDSDILFGGGSNTWVQEAIKKLENSQKLISCSPLPGPPCVKEKLKSQKAIINNGESYSFIFNYFSTRIFFIDRKRFVNKLSKLRPKYSNIRGILKGLITKNGIYEVPEDTITKLMKKNNLIRDDFLGNGKGMWSLHPPYRSELFYEQLQTIITNIENGFIPEEQKGDHDINDSMIDWTSARIELSKRKWWKRIIKGKLN